ncbi:unnamed protein product [marine sediment metagenome]|uniref:Uncharacterized protein n=1 Tax=marine sediment metagenome TaxID=412755 RepID=X0VST0_9ZZZZ
MESITTSGPAKPCRPKVLWLADKPGWAYDSIVKQISAQITDCEHEVFYMLGEHEATEWVSLGFRMGGADIVVAMHWMYQVQLQNRKETTVIMVTGHRGLEE